MAEQWIPASKALEIAESRHGLCARLHAGLVKARATLLQTDSERKTSVIIPPEFWWAEGHEALEQDWEAGDFSTWVEQRHKMQAFGVTIALSGLLEMISFERAPIIARSLSVASNPDWISTKDARSLVYESLQIKTTGSTEVIAAQARLGFVAARAVHAKGNYRVRYENGWHWEEREWDIPAWFWQEFVRAIPPGGWDLGNLSGEGCSPIQLVQMELSGIYFHRASIDAICRPHNSQTLPPPTPRGRRPEYAWSAATSAIWGRLHRAELIPDTQADIERALIKLLAKGDKEPSESTVRPYAKVIWKEFQVP